MWIFGLYDRGTKDCRLFAVGNNRKKDTLLNYIIDNVATFILSNKIIYEQYGSINRNEDLRTRLYTDCFKSYVTMEEMYFIRMLLNLLGKQ